MNRENRVEYLTTKIDVEQMFEEIGYKKEPIDVSKANAVYVKQASNTLYSNDNLGKIEFKNNRAVITPSGEGKVAIDMNTLQAMFEKCKELEWIDMTDYRFAIDSIKYFIDTKTRFTTDTTRIYLFIQMLEQLVEKERERNPIVEELDGLWMCPVCGHYYELSDGFKEYCSCCGQHLRTKDEGD